MRREVRAASLTRMKKLTKEALWLEVAGTNHTYNTGHWVQRHPCSRMHKEQAAKMKKSHRELVELMLPACKRPGATKRSVLAEREKLFTKFAKA